jgi:hypothetical protein
MTIEVERIEEDEVFEDLSTNDEGEYEEVYRDRRTGNIVTHPTKRSAGGMKDPRQDVCWDLYVKGWKAGVPNGKAAALAAGYSENTALNIGNLTWFKKKKENLRRSKMMSNAERNISRMLNMGITKLKKLEDGTTEEVFDAEKARIVADMSKLIVTTLGKDLGYSSKTEVKVSQLPTPIMELDAIDVSVNKELIGNNDPVVE